MNENIGRLNLPMFFLFEVLFSDSHFLTKISMAESID